MSKKILVAQNIKELKYLIKNTKDKFRVLPFLSIINIFGEKFSKPGNLQLSFGLSTLIVLYETKIPSFLYLNK